MGVKAALAQLLTYPRPSIAPAGPSVFIVSLPKSGTVYLNAAFRQNLQLADMRLCNGYFPRDYISVDRLPHFVENGGYVASSHLDPSPANLRLLTALVKNWVVHVRDPRASLLSWTHHVRRLYHEGRHLDLLRVTPSPPAHVLTGSLEACIDWHIRGFYRQALSWIESWVAVADTLPDRILLTEFAELKEDEESLCRQIAAFVGYDPQSYHHRPVAKTMANHYRVGAINEWQRVFTKHQIARTTSMLSPELCRRFGWPHPSTLSNEVGAIDVFAKPMELDGELTSAWAEAPVAGPVSASPLPVS